MRISSIAYKTLVDQVSDIVVIVNGESLDIVDANQAAQDHLGLSPSAMRRRRLTDLMPREDERQILRREVARLFAASTETQATLRMHVGKTVLTPLQVVMTLVRDQRSAGVLTLVARRSGSSHGQESQVDHLTGLPLRRVVEDRLNRLADSGDSGDSSRQHALVFLDIDHFKRINDRHGHLAGDSILRGVAQRLRSSLRPTDLVARFGGDEFVALVLDLQPAWEANRVAHRIQTAMQSPFTVGGSQIVVTASVGVSLSVPGDVEWGHLVHTADRAMYRAKALGRHGRFVVLSAG